MAIQRPHPPAALLGAAMLGALCIVGCASTDRQRSSTRSAVPAPAVTTPAFTDVTLDAGIHHIHHKPVLDHKLNHIMSWMASVGAAAAAADFDRDGRVDLYVTDSDKGRPNRLYRNNGDGAFTDVAVAAGVARVNDENGTSMACAFADYDNDGWPDLYLVRWGRDMLFHNNGDGTFSDVTARLFVHGGDPAAASTQAGAPAGRLEGAQKPGTPWANGNAVVWLDFNNDGRLDLYVGNYFEPYDLWHLPHTRIMHDSFETARNGGVNFLYQQMPDGSFRDVARQLGVDDPGWTLAVGSGDLNNDGWPDLFCANDFGPDQLFLNDGRGGFLNVSERAIGKDTKKGMNAEFGDFDNDGWLDIYVANITTTEYLQEGNSLWRNEGLTDTSPDSLLMTDVALEAGVYDGGWGWGAKFFDYDHDADLDLFAVNGFISAGPGSYWFDLATWTVEPGEPTDAARWPPIGNRSFSGYEATRLWRNDGFMHFTEVARAAGVADTRDGRGVVILDYDDDGDGDVFVANQGARPCLLRNETIQPHATNHRIAAPNPSPQGSPGAPPGRNWIAFDLEGDPALGGNRDAIGARVTVVTENGMQVREVDGGNGFCGQSQRRLHFGLGPCRSARLVEVRWPGGENAQYLENVGGGQVVRVRQCPEQFVPIRLRRAAPAPSTAHTVAAVPLDLHPPDVQERQLSQLEAQLRLRPDDLVLGSAYRGRCSRYGQHDRSIRFLRELAEQSGACREIQLQYACAYIDKIPTCGGLAAVVSKGRLARQSLDVLDDLVRRYPDWWLVYYARGMNHLHWPAALGHLPAAVTDFQRCRTLQARGLARENEAAGVRTFIGLGDAWAKQNRYGEARTAWREGLRSYPRDPALLQRLSLAADADLAAFIVEARGLERPIDTDLGFYEPHQRLGRRGAQTQEAGDAAGRNGVTEDD